MAPGPAPGAVSLLRQPNERKRLRSASGVTGNPLRGEDRENQSQKNELQPAAHGAMGPAQGVGQICLHRAVRARGRRRRPVSRPPPPRGCEAAGATCASRKADGGGRRRQTRSCRTAGRAERRASTGASDGVAGGRGGVTRWPTNAGRGSRALRTALNGRGDVKRITENRKGRK